MVFGCLVLGCSANFSFSGILTFSGYFGSLVIFVVFSDLRVYLGWHNTVFRWVGCFGLV